MIQDDRAYLVEAMAPLCGPVHDALHRALELADAHFDEFHMEDGDFNPGRAHLARCHAKRLLARPSLDLGGWSVSKTRRPNTSLFLNRQGLDLRFLRPALDSSVPAPGSNQARIAYYSNRHTTLLGVAGSSLIALWAPSDNTDGVSVRIVRPRGNWTFGGKHKVDINFVLPDSKVSLDDLEFVLNDDDLEVEFVDDDEDLPDAQGEG